MDDPELENMTPHTTMHRNGWEIIRVPTGWIYTKSNFTYHENGTMASESYSSVFVPYILGLEITSDA